MNFEQLNSHTFIYFDFPIHDYDHIETVWFECLACKQIVSISYNYEIDCSDLTCNEVFIKDIIE